MDKVKLEQQADLLFENLEGWEEKALQRIGTRIGKIGGMTVADVRTLNNIADVKGDIDIIMRELAEVTGYNISQVQKIYGEILSEQHLENKYLYDYRNKDFVPFAENKELQSIVRAYSKSTAETMINLSKTSMIGFFDDRTGFHGIQTAYYDAVDKAVMAVTSGATDFNTAMRDTLKSLGGSGLRVNYGGGVTRRIDTVIRQNLLWGAKQASIAYNDMIGEELDCDGFEIDWHSNPRPSHEFMQGKQFAYGKARTVNGVYYPSGDEALQRLQDYNCYHFKTPIILGVSEPTYSPEELERLNKQNAKIFKIGDVEGNGYFWSQKMRQLETEIRKQKDIKILAEASGDNILAKQYDARIGAFQKKYDEIAAVTGIKPDHERRAVTRLQNVLTNNTNNIIIKENNKNYITKITDNAINKIQKLNIDGFTEEEIIFIQNQHKNLLKYARDNNDNKEVAFVFQKGLKERKIFIGEDDTIDFGSGLQGKGDDLFVMHNHPRNSSFSDRDIRFIISDENIKTISIIKNNGNAEILSKSNVYNSQNAKTYLARAYKKIVKNGTEEEITKALEYFLKHNGGNFIWKK